MARVRKQQPIDPDHCECCSTPVNGEAYRFWPNGRLRRNPLCPVCHERAVRLETRDDVYGAMSVGKYRRRGGVKEGK